MSGRKVSVIVLGLVGLLVAAGLGLATHTVAGDRAGLSDSALAGGDVLAPPDARGTAAIAGGASNRETLLTSPQAPDDPATTLAGEESRAAAPATRPDSVGDQAELSGKTTKTNDGKGSNTPANRDRGTRAAPSSAEADPSTARPPTTAPAPAPRSSPPPPSPKVAKPKPSPRPQPTPPAPTPPPATDTVPAPAPPPTTTNDDDEDDRSGGNGSGSNSGKGSANSGSGSGSGGKDRGKRDD